MPFDVRAAHTALVCLGIFGAGCASAPRDPWFDHMVQSGAVEPSSEVERDALSRMDELPPETPVTVSGVTVLAGVPYAAASARVCRTVQLEGAAPKLACREEVAPDEDAPTAWFFAPSVSAEVAP